MRFCCCAVSPVTFSALCGVKSLHSPPGQPKFTLTERVWGIAEQTWLPFDCMHAQDGTAQLGGFHSRASLLVLSQSIGPAAFQLSVASNGRSQASSHPKTTLHERG